MPSARKLFTATVLGATAVGAQAAFTINLSFSGLSVAEESYFTVAKSFWEGLITGYQATVSLTALNISAAGAAIDGVGGVLGSAGPTNAIPGDGFLYARTGEMRFDTADIDHMIAVGSFTEVIKHEMAHVIGFGTLWKQNGLYTDDTGQFRGSNALREYRVEFDQPGATFVPVELGGGSGTANGHWDEVDDGGSNTGITDTQGRDFSNELMTGWLNTPAYVSRTTIASFQDLGYNVALAPAPEPAAYALLMAGLGLISLQVRRRG